MKIGKQPRRWGKPSRDYPNDLKTRPKTETRERIIQKEFNRPTPFGKGTQSSNSLVSQTLALDAVGQSSSKDDFVRIYLDDERPKPDGWLLARSPFEFFELLNRGKEFTDKIITISLDWYLGVGVVNGEEVAHRLAKMFKEDVNFLPNIECISMHSSDRDAARRMIDKIRPAISQDRENPLCFDFKTALFL